MLQGSVFDTSTNADNFVSSTSSNGIGRHQMATKTVPALWTEPQVSDHFGINLRTLRRWRLDGAGPRWIRAGRTIYYPEDRLIEFINEGD